MGALPSGAVKAGEFIAKMTRFGQKKKAAQLESLLLLKLKMFKHHLFTRIPVGDLIVVFDIYTWCKQISDPKKNIDNLNENL